MLQNPNPGNNTIQYCKVLIIYILHTHAKSIHTYIPTLLFMYLPSCGGWGWGGHDSLKLVVVK